MKPGTRVQHFAEMNYHYKLPRVGVILPPHWFGRIFQGRRVRVSWGMYLTMWHDPLELVEVDSCKPSAGSTPN